jgi:hypothetical protein
LVKFKVGEFVMRFVTSERLLTKPRPLRVTLAEFTRLQLLHTDDQPTAGPDTLLPEPEQNVATHVAAAMYKARAT